MTFGDVRAIESLATEGKTLLTRPSTIGTDEGKASNVPRRSRTVSQILETEDIADIEVINRIAEETGVGDWFVWVGLKDLARSYTMRSRLED